jgi:group I intron endonuclease
MTIYIVYKTINLINGRYYIGKHKTTNSNDTYLGSGTVIKEAIKHYGAENFIKEIIAVYDNELDAFNKEAELVTEDVVNDPLSYNLSTVGLGGRTHSTRSKQQMSANMKGRIPWNKGVQMWSDEDRKRIGELTKKRPPQSEKTKRKRALANTGKVRTEETKANTSAKLKGRVFSEETRRKMSEAKKGKPWTSAKYDAFLKFK